jgi:predicted RNA binding protein YcfA (HicA-like mRNA interferase family)
MGPGGAERHPLAIQTSHQERPGFTIPHPKRDISIGTLKSIEEQAGLKLR